MLRQLAVQDDLYISSSNIPHVYRIEITETAQKKINKRSEPFLRKRLNQRVKKLENDPKIHRKSLRGPLAGIWEIRFERRWRMWYRVYDKQKLIEISAFKRKDEI